MLLFRVAFVIAIIACVGVMGDYILFGLNYKIKVMEYANEEKSLDTIDAAADSLKKFFSASATVAAAVVGITQPVVGAIISLFPLLLELVSIDTKLQIDESILANEIVHIRAAITTIGTGAQNLQNSSQSIQYKASSLRDMYSKVDEWVNYFAETNCVFRKRPLIAIAPLAAIAPLTTIFNTFKNISEPETVYLENITTKFRGVLDQYKKLAVKYRLQAVKSYSVSSSLFSWASRDFNLSEFIDNLANEREISLPNGRWPYIPISIDDCDPADTGYYIADPFQDEVYCTLENGEDTAKLYLELLDCKVNRVFNEIEKMTFISQVKDTPPKKGDYVFFRNKNGIPC